MIKLYMVYFPCCLLIDHLRSQPQTRLLISQSVLKLEPYLFHLLSLSRMNLKDNKFWVWSVVPQMSLQPVYLCHYDQILCFKLLKKQCLDYSIKIQSSIFQLVRWMLGTCISLFLTQVSWRYCYPFVMIFKHVQWSGNFFFQGLRK